MEIRGIDLAMILLYRVLAMVIEFLISRGGINLADCLLAELQSRLPLKTNLRFASDIPADPTVVEVMFAIVLGAFAANRQWASVRMLVLRGPLGNRHSHSHLTVSWTCKT